MIKSFVIVDIKPKYRLTLYTGTAISHSFGLDGFESIKMRDGKLLTQILLWVCFYLSSWISCHIKRLVRNWEIQHCAMAAWITKLVLMFIVFVHDDSALFTIYVCRGAEREGSWDHTLFVGEGNKTHVLSHNLIQFSYHFQYFSSTSLEQNYMSWWRLCDSVWS